MGGLRCDYCGKDWVQPCWDAKEAADCGNLDKSAIDTARALTKAASAAEKIRNAKPRKLTAAQIEKSERKELARLKAKYET